MSFLGDQFATHVYSLMLQPIFFDARPRHLKWFFCEHVPVKSSLAISRGLKLTNHAADLATIP